MPITNNFEVARQKMLQADMELANHVRSAARNSEKYRQLLDAVKSARDEFVYSIASLSPEIIRPPSGPETLGADQRNEMSVLHRHGSPESACRTAQIQVVPSTLATDESPNPTNRPTQLRYHFELSKGNGIGNV